MAASPDLKTQEAQQVVELNIFKTVALEQTNVRHDRAFNQGLFLIPWLEVLSKEWGVYQVSCTTETSAVPCQHQNPAAFQLARGVWGEIC